MAGLMVVIPAYQAAATIARVVDGARGSGLKVVVVDDGSSDGTAALAEAAGATVLRHPGNRGKGAALQTGFAFCVRAGADAVLTLDADLQHDPAEIAALRAAHERAPEALVVGVRRFDEMPARSRTGNRISTYWISRFAGRPHQDTQSGFRVYPSALIGLGGLRSSHFDTETELLLVAARRRIPLLEVPVRTIYAGATNHTHFRDFRDTLRIMRLVIGSPFWRDRAEPG